MCFTGIVYAAKVDTLTLTFQASGALWQDALVMQDMQTKSLWSQVNGECLQGPLKGAKLDLFPSQLTTFKAFARDFPNGELLAKPERGPEGSAYGRYFADTKRLGIFGTRNDFAKLDGKAYVYGLRMHGRDFAVARDYLESHGWAEITVDENEATSPRAIIIYDDANNTARAWRIEAPGDSRVEIVGDTVFVGEMARYDARTGDPLARTQQRLEPLPLVSSFWFAWVTFFSDTELIK
ncbi:DUF3179 domain-containing protein [candidate division GN15 bacterium]|nr:DUF3179 domain-containing protein [candidate division GN15 bacterium]